MKILLKRLNLNGYTKSTGSLKVIKTTFLHEWRGRVTPGSIIIYMTVICVQYYRTWACFLYIILYVYATSIGWGPGWVVYQKPKEIPPGRSENMTKPLHVKNQPTRNNKQLPKYHKKNSLTPQYRKLPQRKSPKT